MQRKEWIKKYVEFYGAWSGFIAACTIVLILIGIGSIVVGVYYYIIGERVVSLSLEIIGIFFTAFGIICRYAWMKVYKEYKRTKPVQKSKITKN